MCLIGKANDIVDEGKVCYELYFTEDAPEGVDGGVWYLGKSIELLAQADVAYFVKGWYKARGCLIENECAF